MDHIPFEQLRERVVQLPDEVQEALVSPELVAQIERIAVSHRLPAELHEGLVHVTGMTIVGVHPRNTLDQQLVRELAIDEARATAIARDVQSQIITPLLASGSRAGDPENEPAQPYRAVHATADRSDTAEAAENDRQQRPPEASEPAAKKRPFNADPYREPIE